MKWTYTQAVDRISKLLAEHRLRTENLAQTPIAKKAGVDQKTISNLERQQTAPRLKTIFGAAEALGVEAFELLLPEVTWDDLDNENLDELFRLFQRLSKSKQESLLRLARDLDS